jgi:hypothetical protein
MSPTQLLQDPDVDLSVAWLAALLFFGPTLPTWEPDTIRMQLHRREIEPTDGLMAKLLAAQTIVTTNAWTYDHDVLFAFALACDGVPANSEAIHHPTPEQLCWAVITIEYLCEERLTTDHGFDPDTIDPAIATVLLDAGIVCPPRQLSFCEDVLLGMMPETSRDLSERVHTRWQKLDQMSEQELRDTLDHEPASTLYVQLQSLADCKLYVSDRGRKRAHQHAELRQPF